MATSARAYTRWDTILLGACVAVAGMVRALPESAREVAASGMRRTVVAPLVGLQRDAELSRRAWLARDATVLAHDSLALRAMVVPALQRENEQLRRLIGLGQRMQWGFVPAEILHGQALADDYTVTLSAGQRAGVKPFSPVVAPDGLIGMVKTVDPTMSTAILWSHPDFRVSAMTADSGVFGIVAAHLGNVPARNLLELRGVPVRSTLKPGTVIWSSGLGGVHPRGIPIGTVIGEEKKLAEGWARTYLVRPAAHPAELDAVMILQSQVRAGGMSSVWASVLDADSAVRRIVAAGDSLKGLAAADSARAAAARRATAPIDSSSRVGVRRDSLQRTPARRDSALRQLQ
ncbi:MAG: rod shape-determining protein MreC [Gemmatimonadaceae bacterium]